MGLSLPVDIGRFWVHQKDPRWRRWHQIKLLRVIWACPLYSSTSTLSGALDLLWNREVDKFVILLSASGYKDSWVFLASSLSFSQSLFWETELVLGWAAARQYKVLPSYIWPKSLVWQFMPFSSHPGRIELGISIFLVENFHRLPHCYLFASTINQTDGFIFSSQVPFSGL